MLETIGLSGGYGGSLVIDDINFRLEKGEAVTLLGPNGAGKSTLIKALTGLLPNVQGQTLFEGLDITALPSHHIVSMGIACSPEGRQIFQPMTVMDNLHLGAIRLDKKKYNVEERLDFVFNLFPQLKERNKQIAGTMSGGEQQMLTIGRALMSAPRILLLDEPFLGLAPKVVQENLDALRILREEGVSQLLVEQKIDIALSFADRAYVLVKGKITASESSEEMCKRDFLELYFTDES